MTGNLDPPGDANEKERAEPQPVKYFSYLAAGLGVAAAWTLVGGAIAFSQGDLDHFRAEWQSVQAFFCIAFGIWLNLIARCGALEERARRLTQECCVPPQGIGDRRYRVLIIVAIGVGGTISITGMGFNAQGPLLVFMWAMSAAVCLAAAFVTLHTIDLLLIVHNLRVTRLKLFQYSPARTPELRDLISYFTVYTLLLSSGFLFAAIGTIQGHWTGDPAYIEAVQWFWPIIYVPTCSAALIYPHVVVHGLIQRAKEHLLLSYQREIDRLLAGYQALEKDQVQRVNTLAELFDRITATPNYVVDVGIAFRTALPLLFNVGILVAKSMLRTS